MKIMNKLQNRKEELRKNNKGFSLVELIIVIAIMAILVGIVGTQVVPYIEKSRKAKDIQQISGLCTDAMTAYSSNAATLDSGLTYTITINSSGVSASDGTNTNDTLANSFKELNNVTKVSDVKFESKEGKKITAVTITCKSAKPMITVEVTGPTKADEFKVTSN